MVGDNKQAEEQDKLELTRQIHEAQALDDNQGPTDSEGESNSCLLYDGLVYCSTTRMKFPKQVVVAKRKKQIQRSIS